MHEIQPPQLLYHAAFPSEGVVPSQGTLLLPMGSLGWKLRRLRAMSAREVATRLVRAVRERMSPLPKEPPDATW